LIFHGFLHHVISQSSLQRVIPTSISRISLSNLYAYVNDIFHTFQLPFYLVEVKAKTWEGKL